MRPLNLKGTVKGVSLGRLRIGQSVNEDARKVLPALKYNLKDRRRFRNVEGPEGRHEKIRQTVTALLKHERIELNYRRGDEARGYAERLISDAIRYGDAHQETMERANYWVAEKSIVHKLFKVIAPKYKDYLISYTRMWKAPRQYPGHHYDRCVLELRNNIYPPLEPVNAKNPLFLHNVLLNEARLEFKRNEASKLLEQLKEDEVVARKLKNELEENELPDVSSIKLSDENAEGDDVKLSGEKLEGESSSKVASEAESVKDEKIVAKSEDKVKNESDKKPRS